MHPRDRLPPGLLELSRRLRGWAPASQPVIVLQTDGRLERCDPGVGGLVAPGNARILEARMGTMLLARRQCQLEHCCAALPRMWLPSRLHPLVQGQARKAVRDSRLRRNRWREPFALAPASNIVLHPLAS